MSDVNDASRRNACCRCCGAASVRPYIYAARCESTQRLLTDAEPRGRGRGMRRADRGSRTAGAPLAGAGRHRSAVLDLAASADRSQVRPSCPSSPAWRPRRRSSTSRASTHASSGRTTCCSTIARSPESCSRAAGHDRARHRAQRQPDGGPAARPPRSSRPGRSSRRTATAASGRRSSPSSSSGSSCSTSRWAKEGLAPFLPDVARRDALHGSEIEIGSLRGTATGIAEGGELVLETAEGRRLVSTGEVTLIGPRRTA